MILKNKALAKKIISLVCVLGCLLGSISLSSCSMFSKDKKFTAEYFDFFDTYSVITIYTHKESEFERYKEIADELLAKYHKLLDIYNEYDGINNLATVNREAGVSWVEADEELIEAVEFGIEVYYDTKGTTNIAMGATLKLWHNAFDEFSKTGSASIPDRDSIKAALKNSNIKYARVNSKRTKLYVSNAEASINLGSIAKGFVADKLFEALKEAGCQSFLIDLGGNIQSYGIKPDSTPWTCEIYNPTTQKTLTEKPLALRNLTISTSGSYQRYITVDGTDYGHIIDYNDGMPADRFASVSVIAVSGNSAMADALSTALFILPFSEGFELIDKFDDFEAVWIMKDGSVKTTDNFDNYILD